MGDPKKRQRGNERYNADMRDNTKPKYLRSDDGHIHITTYMIIREVQRLLSEGDKIGYAKGAKVAKQLFKTVPLDEFNLCLDDFSDKYIVPGIKKL